NQIQMTPPVLPVRYHAFKPLIDRMLAKNPEQRFANCQELLQTLAYIAPIDTTQENDSDKTLLSNPVTTHLHRKLPRIVDVATTVAGKISAWWSHHYKIAAPAILLVVVTGLAVHFFTKDEVSSQQQLQEQQTQQHIAQLLQQAEHH